MIRTKGEENKKWRENKMKKEEKEKEKEEEEEVNEKLIFFIFVLKKI